MKEKYKNSSILEVDIENVLRELSKDIRINNINSIRDYLIEFPDIIDIIPKAINSAKKYFPNAQIVLDFIY
jgi:hypothetical protein